MQKLDYELVTWRILVHEPAGGAWNMAVDEAILESVGNGQSLPTLRLYAWQPACLSLGYAQRCRDVDLDLLHRHGWDWVRRPTGGRAILHTDELTYSVIGPQSEPRLEGSVLESYRRLAQALVDALHRLKIPAAINMELSPVSHAESNGPVCFETPSSYEIVVNGKKLIGSAQARRKEGVLQHGSLPLFGDLARIIQALAFPDEAARLTAAQRLHERATTAEEVLGYALDWNSAAGAFQAAFADILNLELLPGELTNTERQRAEALVQEKYAHPSWTERI